MSKHKAKSPSLNWRWLLVGGILIGLLVFTAVRLVQSSQASESKEAPEAQKILDIQANMPFQVLIPAYLPKAIDRLNVQVDITQSGPGGEPMAQLTYRTSKGQTLFIRQWVPVNPEKEILASSRPVETKWGSGWLLRQGEGLIAIWVDIGPLRASIFTSDQTLLSPEELLVVADTMGPASNRQVFNFVLDPPDVRAVEPPPPVEIPLNAEGIQEVDLIITPGGYSPLRFAVKKDLPVRLIFRQLGQVGCGNELNFPTGPDNMVSLKLDTPTEQETYEFTPATAGEFQFYCGHLMYRGIMFVKE
jgi:hypothetical protein